MIDLQEFLSRGRAALVAREEARLLEERADEERRRTEKMAAWKRLIGAVEAIMPEDFWPYMVEPENTPGGGDLPFMHARTLVYDFTPLGLWKVAAIEASHMPGGVGWMPPTIGDAWDPETEEATGLKQLTIAHGYHAGRTQHIALTFEEALALCADRLAEVQRHNDWVTSPKPKEEAPAAVVLAGEFEAGLDARVVIPGATEPDAAAATRASGVWPVIRAGLTREDVHDMGEEAVREFGTLYGAKDWDRLAAIHTMTFVGDMDEGGKATMFYVYLALVPVDPAHWDEVLGGEPSEQVPAYAG